MEDGQIILNDGDKIWKVNSTGGNIVSPVSHKVVSPIDDKKIIIERRKGHDRRQNNDRRVGETERRKKKKFTFREKRKKTWQRRTSYDRRFNASRRQDTENNIKILSDNEHIAENINIKKNNDIEYISSSTLKEGSNLAKQRIEIIPKIHHQHSNSISIQSGRESEAEKRELISLGCAEITDKNYGIIPDDIEKKEISLENGTRIGYVYRYKTIEDGVGNNFIEIVDSTLDSIDLHYIDKEIVFQKGTLSIPLNVDKSSHETINIIINRDINIYLDQNSSGFIKLGSYRTFEH